MKLAGTESKKAGLAPGTVLHIGDSDYKGFKIEVYDFTQEKLERKDLTDPAQCAEYLSTDTVTWINICGLSRTDKIEELGQVLGLHPLTLEDIVNTNQRPKLEEHEEYTFIVLKMVYLREQKELMAEQLSMIAMSNVIVTFQENPEDVFGNLRKRLESTKTPIRKRSADFLLYALIDSVVDNYFEILEWIGEKVEDIEDDILAEQPVPGMVENVYNLRRDLIYLRKVIWPTRELIGTLEKTGDGEFWKEDTRNYLRDLRDHSLQILDNVEVLREVLAELVTIHLSAISNRLNQVMKFLTIISTIFIPLTFIVGIYGMNFKFMPELGWKLGYPGVMIFMLVLAVIMFFYFKKRKWF